MGIGGLAVGIAAEAAAKKARMEAMKRGKSPEQCRVIDFFFGLDLGKKGCGGCLSKASSHYTMAEYNKLVQDKCDMLDFKRKALDKIGLDESQIQEIAPLTMAGYLFDDDDLVKVEDGMAVSNRFSVTWIFFSATQMYTYKYIFDTTSDSTWEYTNDFFYSDITCLSTVRRLKEQIDAVPKKGCLGGGGTEYVKHNYTVDTMEIVVPGTSYSFSIRNAQTFESSVQAAKAMLREKKYMK